MVVTTPSQQKGVFATYEEKGYEYKFAGHIVVDALAGGTPSNPDVAEAWIRSKGYNTSQLKDELIRTEVAKIMDERGVSSEEAIEQVVLSRHLNGFKRDPERGLYIEGRQLKACIKEAVSVAADVGKLKVRGIGANQRKGILSFVAEHIFVVDQKLYLDVQEPSEVWQSFIHTWRGHGIQYVEVVHEAEFDFVVETDTEFSEEEWAMLWLTAQRQGVGACRSQGYGRFTLTQWEPLGKSVPKTIRRKSGAINSKKAQSNNNGADH